MNDEIKIGLDFGTHQTKICVQFTPDEGRGEPRYEFFQFADLKGKKQYFLPSVIQINDDDTLSYGYVDSKIMKADTEQEESTKQEVTLEEEFDVEELASELYDKYSTEENQPDDVEVLSHMLKIRLQNVKARNTKRLEEADNLYDSQQKIYQGPQNVFRYFKQATFVGEEWKRVMPISNHTLCVWYLAYIIFLLEKEYGTNFSINMGVPADESNYEAKKRLAVEILATSYYLVENVYENDLDKFLKEKYTDLLAKTEDKKYSQELKKEYFIDIFPEAYASLIALTSRGKLPPGMSLTADIGGGTTDISFFTIEKGLPMIYKFWSISRGLNYVAERSGFDYADADADGDFSARVNQDVVEKFNRKKYEHVYNLVRDLEKKIRIETSLPVQKLRDALKDRILVYSGGGSTFDFLTQPIYTFTDVRIIDDSIWKEENIKNKATVSKLSVLLTTAYGLSQGISDENVELKSYDNLFTHLRQEEENTIEEVSKDQC